MMPPEDPVNSDIMPMSISADYETLITECFEVMGLDRQLIKVSVRPVGVTPGGLDIYAAFIKVVRWEPRVVDLLSRMPAIERKVDRRIRLSSVLRYSSFAGLWFRTPANIEKLATAVH